MDDIDVYNIYEQVEIILDKFLKSNFDEHVLYCENNPINEVIDAFEKFGYFASGEQFVTYNGEYDYVIHFKNGQREVSYCVSNFYNKSKLTKLWM